MGAFLENRRRAVAWLGCAAAAALAACGEARAQDPGGAVVGGAGSAAGSSVAPAADGATRLEGVVAVPGAWSPQAGMAASARQAAGAGVEVAAWGDAGLGCFAVVIAARTERQNPEDALEELRATMADELGLEGWAVTSPTEARGQIVRGAMRGEVRGGATVAAPKGAAVTLAACFYNQRDPDGCAAQCQGVLASLDVSKVKP